MQLTVAQGQSFPLPPLANNMPLHRPELPTGSFPSTAPVPYSLTLRPFTLLAHTPCDLFLPTPLTIASCLPAEPLLPPVHTFPAVLQSSFTAPSHFASVTHVHTSQQPAPLSNPMCHVSPPLLLTVAVCLPFLIQPPPTFTFPTASEPQVLLTPFVHPPAFEQHAPFTTTLCEVLPPAPSPSTSPQSYQVPPSLADLFLLAPQPYL
jgi:hypothetical protein